MLDVVAESLDGASAIVGEARFHDALPSLRSLERDAGELASRPLPEPLRTSKAEIVRALFVPALPKRAPARIGDVHLVGDLRGAP
ncbi:hypothetical protein [Pendulispora albinea]|uniref:Uncharacterized protein n=1 Tax=Pendulispora albinea TaxID=2741071 RepID=A0ABZ2M7X2_9BACT